MIWKLKHSDWEIFPPRRKVTHRGASSRANATDLRKISPGFILRIAEGVETTARFLCGLCCGRYSDIWLRLCRAVTFVVNSTCFQLGGIFSNFLALPSSIACFSVSVHASASTLSTHCQSPRI